MRGTKIFIILGTVLLSNLNCNKNEETIEETIIVPEVITIGETASERWNDVNYLRYVYIGEGKVISDGGGDCTFRMCYSSINESPTISDAYSSGVPVNGSFECKMNLQSGQVKYYVRAFAKNKAGISYGETVSYTTYCGTDFDGERSYQTPPSRLIPDDGAIVSPLSVTLSWIQSTGGSYDLYLDTSPDVAKKIASDVELSSYKIDSLKSSTTYYWKVIKRWPPCKEISSVINKFTTTQ